MHLSIARASNLTPLGKASLTLAYSHQCPRGYGNAYEETGFYLPRMLFNLWIWLLNYTITQM
jgi:hypothetical protein